MPTDRGAWQDIVHGVAKSRTRLSVYSTMPNKYPQKLPSSLLHDWEKQSFQSSVSGLLLIVVLLLYEQTRMRKRGWPTEFYIIAYDIRL